MRFIHLKSETRSWRVSGRPFPLPYGLGFRNGVYCNGSVYYLSELKSEVNSSDCWYFNVEDERLQTFPRPPIASNFDHEFQMKFLFVIYQVVPTVPRR